MISRRAKAQVAQAVNCPSRICFYSFAHIPRMLLAWVAPLGFQVSSFCQVIFRRWWAQLAQPVNCPSRICVYSFYGRLQHLGDTCLQNSLFSIIYSTWEVGRNWSTDFLIAQAVNRAMRIIIQCFYSFGHIPGQFWLDVSLRASRAVVLSNDFLEG